MPEATKMVECYNYVVRRRGGLGKEQGRRRKKTAYAGMCGQSLGITKTHILGKAGRNFM